MRLSASECATSLNTSSLAYALMAAFVRYGEALAAFGTTTGQHVAAVSGFHTVAETVLVAALALRGLVGAFHVKSIYQLGRQRYGFSFRIARCYCENAWWPLLGNILRLALGQLYSKRSSATLDAEYCVSTLSNNA